MNADANTLSSSLSRNDVCNKTVDVEEISVDEREREILIKKTVNWKLKLGGENVVGAGAGTAEDEKRTSAMAIAAVASLSTTCVRPMEEGESKFIQKKKKKKKKNKTSSNHFCMTKTGKVLLSILLGVITLMSIIISSVLILRALDMIEHPPFTTRKTYNDPGIYNA